MSYISEGEAFMTMTNIENAKQNTPVAKKERYLNYRDIILLENGMTVATFSSPK